MKRRDFLRLLGVSSAMLATPAYALIGTGETVKRYRALLDLSSHGNDDENGHFVFCPNQEGAIRSGDILIRLGHEPTDGTTIMGWKWDRVYNETQDRIVWFPHFHGFWSDRKADCVIQGGSLPTWFELVS